MPQNTGKATIWVLLSFLFATERKLVPLSKIRSDMKSCSAGGRRHLFKTPGLTVKKKLAKKKLSYIYYIVLYSLKSFSDKDEDQIFNPSYKLSNIYYKFWTYQTKLQHIKSQVRPDMFCPICIKKLQLWFIIKLNLWKKCAIIRNIGKNNTQND